MFQQRFSLALLIFLLVSLSGVPQTGLAQPVRERYFPQTGYTLADPFLQFWENTPNALYVLGYPISRPFMEESFTQPGQEYQVQYFERAVLEKHPEHRQPDNQPLVQGRLLGRLLVEGRENERPFQPVPDPGDGSWFPETGHTLRDSPAPFRTFFALHGGLQTFGYPLSEPFEETSQDDGKTYLVQYFERQRMEWHPNLPDTNHEVMLGLLGKELHAQRHAEREAFNTPLAAEENRPKPFIYGYNAMLYHDMAEWQDRKRVLQLASESGVYWIRQHVSWKDLHKQNGDISWGELDELVADVHEAGMNLLLVVVQAPWWATPNGMNGLPTREHFATFADFMGQMADRYQGKVQAYEIWNEQNLACQNGGDCSRSGGIGGRVISPDHYVDMLYEAYYAIKKNDINAIVVSGATASSEMNDPDYAISDTAFLQAMITNPRFRADVIGVHPGDRNNPPDTFWPDNPGPGPGWQQSREFYFRRIEDLRQVMVENGKGNMQMWITEFGWATTNITPGFEYGNQNTFEEQANWIVRAFEKGRYEYAPWVGAMFVWNLNFAISWKGAHNHELHEQASYSVLNGDWTPRPAWYAIREMPKN
jgi:hypothetical protein